MKSRIRKEISPIFSSILFVVFWMFMLMQGNVAAAGNLTVKRSFDPECYDGYNIVTVEIEVTGNASLKAFSFKETLPKGWAFEDYDAPKPTPAGAPEEDDQGDMEFFWTKMPTLPYTFSYTVKVPADASGDYKWSGIMYYAESGGTIEIPVGGDQVLEEYPTPSDLVVTRSFNPDHYRGYSVVTVEIEVTGNASLKAFSFKETLPKGWAFEDYDAPKPTPAGAPEEDAEGDIEFFWTKMPTLPYKFSYTVKVPTNASGDYTWSGVMYYAESGGTVEVPISGDQVLEEGLIPPIIITQPKSQTVNEGSSVTFSVMAEGTAPLSYQWYKDGSVITNATKASYTISSVKSSDVGSYKVTVSNNAGSVTSNEAKLKIDDWGISIDGPSSVNKGEAAKYTCIVTYSNGTTNILTPKWSVSNTNYASITTNGVLTGIKEGDIILTAYHTEGKVTKAVTKNVTITKPIPVPPYIITQPKSQTVKEGSSVTFSVEAEGTAPLSYQWYKDGSVITNATKASYTISSAKSSDDGSYTVIVSNSVGSVTSNKAQLTVIKLGPIISIVPIENGTKVRIEFIGMLQESTDMKTWKNVTDKSPYTTGVWGKKKFYRSYREINIDPIAIVPIANSTKVMITFTGMLQESTDMKTWKNVTDKSPYTTGVWGKKKFYRSYSGASVKSAASNDITIPLLDTVDLDMLLNKPDTFINNEVSN